jgi:hypothetical protein
MGPGDFDYDVFADLFRGRGEGRHFWMPPQDVRYALKIDFLDAVKGTHKMVAMPDGKRSTSRFRRESTTVRCSVLRVRDCRDLMWFMQAHHLDLNYHAKFFRPGACGRTHEEHMNILHPGVCK